MIYTVDIVNIRVLNKNLDIYLLELQPNKILKYSKMFKDPILVDKWEYFTGTILKYLSNYAKSIKSKSYNSEISKAKLKILYDSTKKDIFILVPNHNSNNNNNYLRYTIIDIAMIYAIKKLYGI